MARSQDGLIDFLVAEIASTGQLGCTPSQILSLVDRFVAAADGNGPVDESTEEAYGDPKPSTVDSTLQEQTWASLTEHPNISVGRDCSFNNLPLAEVDEAICAVERGRVTVFASKTPRSSTATDDGAAAVLVQEAAGSIDDALFGARTSLRANSRGLDEVAADDGLKAANPGDFKPAAGDLVAVERGNGECAVEEFNPCDPQGNDDCCAACGDVGELVCCDGCPNVFHGACLEPPVDTDDLPDDQWYCPDCETSRVPDQVAAPAAKSSFMPREAITPRAASAKKKGRSKPLGRPRKFLPGTEQFWRAQFPKAPALFASRPLNFDATLLRALDNGLPTPVHPADVSQNWVDKTLAVLNRSAHGLYVSPQGNVQRASGNRKAKGQIVIFRSARLREVDLSNGHELSAVRFLSSSAAHTFLSLRYYPQATKSGSQSRSGLADDPRTRTTMTPQTPARRKGPKLGIFYDNTYQQHRLQDSSFVPVATTSRRNSGHSVSTIGSPIGVEDVHSHSPMMNPLPVFARSSETVPSRDHSPPEVAGGSAAYGLTNRLPPPMTTRAASKRQASTLDRLVVVGAGALQGIATNTRPRMKSPAPQESLLQKDQSRKRQLSDVDRVHARPTKRGRKPTGGSSLPPMCQQIILNIIERSGGAIPDNSLQLGTAVMAAWHKSGESGVPDKTTVDANLKALCTAGKIKKSTFSFKDPRGLMVMSSIVAKPEVGPQSSVMRQLQKNIIDVYPNQYTPSGMFTDQASQVEGNLGPQPALQLPSRRGNWATRAERTKSSLALQPIENEASGSGKNVEHVSGTKETAGREPRRGPIFPPRPVLGDTSRPRSSSRPFGPGLGEDVSFLMRQERPIIFDAKIPSSLSNSATKNAERVNKKVVWRKGSRARPMPRSLGEILDEDPCRDETDRHLTKSHLDLSRFESEVDSVARWEERSFNRFQEQNDSQTWDFISHFVNQKFEAVRVEKIPVRFNGLTWYDGSGREKVHLPAALKRLWAPLPDTPRSPSTRSSMIGQQLSTSITAQFQTIHVSETSPRASNSRSGASKKRKRKPAKKKPSKKRKGKEIPRNQRRTEVEPAYITNPDGTVVDVSGYINAPVKRARGTQHLRNMSEAAIYKLTVAIVVIRTLSGGIDKNVDWDIVMRLFPDEDLDFIYDRWKTIRTKFRRDIAALTANLQTRFCSAYVEGEVADVDFDDLYNNDWEGIVDWAVRNLDKSCVKGIEDLPGTRDELADTKLMSFEEQRGMREYLGYNVGSSVPVREVAQASTVFAKPVESLLLQPPTFSSGVLEAEDEQLKIAKSWALATVLTPEGKYDAHACKKKLSKLASSPRASDALFDRALKSLSGLKAIYLDQEAPSKIIGRGHKAGKLFYDAIDARRTVQAKVLRQAAHYKRDVLDPTFRDGQRITFQPTSVQDGDMVAILNLLANGRIRVQIGPDVPKNRYGLLTADGTGTYQTRHLEKDKLSFTVLVEAVEGNYVYGNPVEMQIAPVPAIAEYKTMAIPVWIDIHGNFQQELWELVICAVIGLISTRPGINAKELVKTLSPSLTLWETEIVLQWLERSGFVGPSGAGSDHAWETTEWWWLVCGGLNGWHLGNLS